MKSYTKNVLSIIILVFSLEISAGDIFTLKSTHLVPEEKLALETFLKKVSEEIPPKIIESLKKPIGVSFENFLENSSSKYLPVDKCNNSIHLIYGKSNSLNKQISMNQLLVSEIIKGERNSLAFDCGHKNYYKTAMATLIHEVAHLYDHSQFGTAKISGQKSFFKLSDWKKNILLFASSKNTSQKRSIDPYEFKNLEEHYAVNFEYFILDQDYKCKRPSYYLYFQEQFKTSPHAEWNCSINTQIRLDDSKELIDINPDRVYRVDYLLATKGDEMISGFGHSMYRLVVCAPFRKVVGPDCQKDKLYHVVLSFRANVTDIKSNPLKGLIGKYDSILFMLSFPKVIEEYNMAELRDLYSLPLTLNADQKARFIYKAIETYWGYSGSYKFITSNCASESNELLQAALNDHSITNENVVKPYSLMESLISHNLSSNEYFKDLNTAKKNGLLFESDAKLLEAIKTRLFGNNDDDFESKIIHFYNKNGILVNTINQKKKKHIKDILDVFPIVYLQEKLTQLENEEETLETKKYLDDLSIMTQAALNIGQHKLDEEIGSYLESLEKDTGLLGSSIRNWNTKRKNFRLTPLKEDYGIPLQITDEDFEAYKQASSLLENTEMELVNDVKDRFKDKVEELTSLQKVIAKARTKSKIIGMKIYLSK